ncbi:MAG: ubiquinone biosynthesis hydroxylase [Pseudomonadota bacterium]
MARTPRSKTTKTKMPRRVDVLIGGAGYVGLATGLAIAKNAPDLNVAIVDAAPEGVWEKDTRASAIAAAATRMLDELGCWEDIVKTAQPMTEMIVTDSRASDVVRPVFLTFDGEVEPGEAFAHMVENVHMVRALRKQCDAHGVMVFQGQALAGFEAASDDGSVTVETADGESVEASLLIACDGVRSRLRDMAGIKTVSWQYGQSGIVATIEHERDHGGRAEEHFLPAGPFAILPLSGNRSSIVWTERTEAANRLVAADEFTFEFELEQRFGHHLGEIKPLTKPRAYPLGLTLSREFIAHRFALAGDAAHGIHPIAGQGLNLGLKDAAAIAQVVVEAHRLGQDFGTLDVLDRYQRWRRFDTLQMGVTTDVLNRLFSNDIAPVRAARNIGLGIVDRLPAMKTFFIRQAAGLAQTAPNLLQGKPI